jgi:outer membrane usher protein
MRGAWILTSTWEALSLPVALAGSVLLGSYANPVSAQAVPLTLKLSRRLADSPIVDQGKAVPRTIPAAADPGLRLALSKDLTITRIADKGPAPVTAAGPATGTGGAPPPQPATNPSESETIDPARTPQAPAGDMEEMVLEVDVNQQSMNDTAIVLRAKDGVFFVAEEDLDRWRLRKPGVVALKYGGSNYYPASSIPGAKFQFDRVKQTLRISANAEAFGETNSNISRTDLYSAPILPQPGGFLNYNLSATRSTDSSTVSGAFDAGFFSRYGSLTSGFLAPTLNARPTLTRLQTTYVIDSPEKLTSLRFGDTINQGGTWGLPVLFGGIQYGTNFATQPGFVRTPTALTAGGQATLPSTVDVFVNNALVSRQTVPPGPFSITNIPIVSGTGEARLVVRDLLGREQVITQPFYGTATLLKEGLSDYSYELGAQRQNFGLTSNDYAGGLATATYRKGLTDAFTAELHGEASGGTTAVGVSTVNRVGRLGVVNASLAGSHSDAGTGRLMEYGFERQGREFSFSLRSQLADNDFRQIGLAPGQPPRRRQDVVSLGLPFGRFGSVALSRISQKSAGQPDTEVMTFGYTLQLGSFAQLGITALRVVSDITSNSLFTTLTIPLGSSTSLSVGSERQRDSDTGSSRSLTTTLQQSLPVGPGYGYRIQDRDGSFLGNLSMQNNVGTYQVEASRAQGGAGGTPVRLGVAGGIGLVGGHAFFSRAITDSFGIVRVADYPNVSVLQDHQVVGKTDANGYAVLPRMRAYDKNIVSVDQNDLPLDAAIGSLKLVATPYFRSGVLIDFPVKRERGGTLRVILDDGSDLPSGALSKIEGKDEEFPVALRGEAYLTGFEAANRIRFTWKGRSCTIDVPYPATTTETLPYLGKFVCKGVQP